MIASVETWGAGLQVDAILRHLLEERNLPLPKREWEFCAKRKFRFDYAFVDQKIAIEVEGGRWRYKGAHNTGGAIARDCAKSNLAQTQGWIVLRVFPETLRESSTIDLIEAAFALR